MKTQKRERSRGTRTDLSLESKGSNKGENDGEKISLYESIRLKNIEEKKALLKELGFCNEDDGRVKEKKGQPKKKSLPAPRNRSARIEQRKQKGLLFRGSSIARISGSEIKIVGGECEIPSVAQMDLDDFFSIRQDFKKSCETLNSVRKLVNTLDRSDSKADDSKVLKSPDDVTIEKLGYLSRSKILTLDIYPEANIKLFGAGDINGEVGLWFGDEKGTCVSLQPHSKSVNCIQFNPWNPPQTLTSSDDGFLRSLDLSSQKLEIVYQWDKFTEFDSQEKAIAWHVVTSPKHLLLCHKKRGRIYRFDARSGKRSFLMTGNESKISVSFFFFFFCLRKTYLNSLISG